MDSIFQNLSMMYQSKQVQVAFNGGNPFNSTGGSFLKLVQNGFDTQLVLNFKPLDYTLNDSPVYSSFEQVIGNLQNVKASNLSDSNFYSFVTNQNYSPFTITTLSGGSSNDNLNVIADFTLARGLGSADTINANDFNNVTLDGGDGYDELNGGLGDNLFIVNSIYDTVVGGGGVDTIQTSVSYSLENTGVDNLIFTGTAAAALTGNGRAGSIIGGAGADTLRDGGDGIVSESGATTLIGGAGNDRYEVSNSDVVIVESLTGGIDTVVSSVDYVLANAANVENLILTGDASSGYGNAGANLIVGNDGGSTLVGLQGSDTIVGGAGGDLIFGAQATEKLGTIIYSGVDLSSLITPDIDGNLAFLGAMSDGAMVAQVDDEDGTYFVKVSKNGDIDTSFGGDGSLSPFDVFGDLEVTGVDTTDASVVLLADGRFLVSGLEKDGKEAYARLTANGALDTTFGSGGYFTPESFLANGETLLAQFGNGVDGFLVAKTTATGTRFQVFNMDGKLPAGAPTGASQAFVSSDYDFSSLTTDPNVQVQGTKVVIQGFKTIGLDAEQNPIQVPVLVRLTATGALDTTGTTAFGISGILTLGSDTLTSAFDFLDADIQVRGDAIYVSDISQTVGETINQAVLRYSADGKTPVAVNFSADDEIQDLKILSDGRIVAVVGQSSDAGDSTLFKVYNYNTSTKTYASSPISSTATSDYSYEGGLLVAQGAKILVQLADSEGNPALARLNADATLDSTFGVGGFFLVPDAEEGETYDFDDLQITISDGKLLAAGIKLTTDDGESALVVRLTADGKYDTTFGVNGVLSSEPGEGGVGFRVLSNGAIVLVDGSSEGSSATLYTKDGKLDTNFGSDTLGADSLVGGAGDDTIVGGAGKATMDGGLGDDFYVVNNPATVIRESTLSGSVTLAGDNEGEDIEVPLNGIDTVATSVNYTLGGGLEDLIGMGAVGLSLAGNSGANYIEGTYGNDTIFAGAGDNVSGGGGRDRYIVQDISAVIEGNEEGLDTLLSASSYNLSNATNIANLIYTGTAGATLTGNGGAGSIIGGSGNDTLRDGGQTVAAPGMDTTDTVAGGNSASGATTLVGGAGNDRYEVSNSEVVIVEGATGGTDTVVSSVDYSLSQAANVENLVLAGDASFGQGNAGANLIVGNDNRDTLVGLQGADTIRGGTGDDLIFGGNATFSIGRLTAPAGISFDNNSAVMLKDGSFIVRGSNEEGNSVIARYSKAGVLNTSFGSGGVITLPEGVEYPWITEQADGKLRLEGGLVEEGESGMEWVGSYLAQYTVTGQLDATFGIGGVLTAPSGGTIQGSQTATDGSIYASITDGDDISFIRYSKDGKIDNTFAGNTGKITAPAGISFDNNSAVMLKDGSFIVRGSNEEGNSVIARYSKAGVLNTSFGSGGVITLPEGVEYPCITEQADGKLRLEGSIVEQGEMSDMNWVGSYLAQYTATGQLDATFGIGGVLTAPSGGTIQGSQTATDGSIYASITDGDDVSFIRYSKDGKIDNTFAGNTGKITAPEGISFDNNSAVMLKDGSFIVRGSNEEGNSVIARYSKAGVLNTSFGSGGVITLPEGVEYPCITEQADGKLRLEGSIVEQGEMSDMNWVGSYLAQYTATGQLDATFGIGGVLTAPSGGTIQGSQTATDGSIYASITDGDDISFIRYSKDGKLDMTFAGDTVGDTLIGGDGDDTLVSGVVVSSLVGGSGDDVYFINNSGTVINDTAGTDTVYTTANFDLSKFNSIENLVFANGIGGASLIGNTLANSIVGDESNDTINGGVGADTMVGGAGNDFYIVDNAGDTIVEDANEGIDTASVIATVAQLPSGYTLSAHVENLILGGNAALSGYGNDMNNRLVGNSVNNILDGAEGDNTLDGGVGRDTLRAGSGDDYFIVDNTLDVIEDGGGSDSVEARVANYALAAGLESLILGAGITSGTGNIENNILVGNSVANTLRGLDGDDTLDGGLGADSLVGGNGNDYYIIDNAGDRVTESTIDGGSAGGIDTVEARVTGYTLANGVENLVLFGTVAAGTGNSLDNFIAGNSVANTLNGEAGVDTMFGGAGNDLYIVDNGGDTIQENADEGIDTVSVTATLTQLPSGYTLASNVENLILGGSASLSGYGNELNNWMIGNSANNILDGGEGNNTLDGGVGKDTLLAGSGNDYFIIDNTQDVIVDLGGYDSVEARVANCTLAGGLESLVLGVGITSGVGNTENNILVGNSVANTLRGLEGNDTLDGGLGADYLEGGNGNDYYIVDNVGDKVIESTVSGGVAGGIDTIEARVTGYTLSGGVENLLLFGTVVAGTGNSLNNLLQGNAVANTLNGAVGADTMFGGAGNDLYFVDNAGDTVVENESEGIDTVSVTATLTQLPSGYTLASNVENLILGGSASLSGYGNELNNWMIGNSANNILDGGEGNNTLDGGVGKDTLLAGSGNDYFIIDNTQDVIVDLGGYDSVEARVANCTLAGGLESLVLGVGITSGVGNTENNILVGNSVANTLRGLEGNDTLDGGLGADYLEGGNGNDYYIVDNAGDKVIESTVSGGVAGGIDTIEARVTGYTLANGVENLVLFGTIASGTGNSLDNVLLGNSANNSLIGGAGNDTLSAAGLNLGIGQKDTLTGGNGADYFILGDLNGAFYTDGNILSTGVADYAYITDFDANADKLVLSGTESNYTIVTGAGIGVTGLTGNGYYGLFREEGTTDELIAVLKSGNTNGKAIGDFAQFL